MFKRLTGALICALAVTSAQAQPENKEVKIGVLTDMSGVYADITGKGSILAARMAVEDFGGKVLGKEIKVVAADHQNKPDLGNSIARKWFDLEGVDAIADVPNSAVALSVMNIAKEKNKAVMFSGSVSPDITGKSCTAISTHWSYDAYSLSNVTAKAMLKQGSNTWYFITLDAMATAAFQRDTTKMIEAGGGQVVGTSKHPINASDFASFLLQAQASKAKVIALVNAGGDTVNAVKQASEFGVIKGGQKIVGLLMQINDVHGIGLNQVQGVLTAESFYWDADEGTRAFSKRYMARHNGVPPNQIQAGVYSGVTHYLKAVAAAKTTDGAAVTKKMKELPVNDFYTKNVSVRQDGRVMRDFFLLEVKAPAESKGPWDYYKVLARVPGAEAYRSLAEGGCPLVKN